MRLLIQSIAILFLLNKFAFGFINECIIYSDYYNNQYIYAPSDFLNLGSKLLGFDRYSLVWRGSIINRIFSGQKNVFFDSDQSALWELVTSIDTPNGYYLRNIKYNEYLYASRYKYNSLFSSKRRRVFTRKIPDSSDAEYNKDQFVWRFIPQETPDTFHIYNQYFNEPLYVASIHFKHDELRRNVFTWHTSPDSKQFLFSVSCRNGMLSLDKKIDKKL